MTKAQTVIELNGKRYNALNGQVISDNKHEPKKPVTSTTHIDGFQPHVHRKPERSKTLMRHAVKKPQSLKPDSSSAPTNHIALHNTSTHRRLERATHIPQNPTISKFGPASKVVKKFAHVLPVKEPPTMNEAPVNQLFPNKTINPFHNALHNATAHTQPKLKKRSLRSRAAHKLKVSTRTINVGAASLAVVLLGGFIAYQNVPNVAVRVAASRAGVHAGLPGYQPAGFSLKGSIQAHPGQVILTYHSNSDDRQFKVSQSSSSWNNESLVENFVAVNQRPYQTYEKDGKTIFIYNDNNATWVDKGVWYQVEGKSSLNSDQLLRLATSL